jgi:hypothetical protein
MSDAQIQFILKKIPIDQDMNNIFTVFNEVIDIMISTKKRWGENFKFDIDIRIKLTIIYNNFRHRFPDLYGNLDRHISIVNDKGDDVYYLAFSCDTRNISFEKYEQTDSIVISGEVIKKVKWNEEIDFTNNKAKKMENQ